ncbi:hypothetical protein HMPREF3038_00753 [Akkermansia sp. KLE1797]|nr:hypothetical protein HMPREF3038_00753 [Akkermansia sp. KLE1797]
MNRTKKKMAGRFLLFPASRFFMKQRRHEAVGPRPAEFISPVLRFPMEKGCLLVRKRVG